MTSCPEARVSMHRENKTTSKLREFCKAFWIATRASRPYRRTTEDHTEVTEVRKGEKKVLKGFDIYKELDSTVPQRLHISFVPFSELPGLSVALAYADTPVRRHADTVLMGEIPVSH